VSFEPTLHQQGVKRAVLGLTWLLPLIFWRALLHLVCPCMHELSQALRRLHNNKICPVPKQRLGIIKLSQMFVNLFLVLRALAVLRLLINTNIFKVGVD
jgi:hypothetical protein